MWSGKCFREGYTGDIEESAWGRALFWCTAITVILAVITSVIVYHFYPYASESPEAGAFGLLVKFAHYMGSATPWRFIGRFFYPLSLMMFLWYWYNKDERFYLGDFPEYTRRNWWMLVVVLAGLPFLLISNVCVRRRRAIFAERDQEQYAVYPKIVAQYGYNPVEIEEYKTKMQEGFVEYCVNYQKSCAETTESEEKISLMTLFKLVKELLQQGRNKLLKSEINSVTEDNKQRQEYWEAFDRLLEQREIIKIEAARQYDSGPMVLMVYAHAKVRNRLGDLYDLGDYCITFRGYEVSCRLLRSGMSANGMVTQQCMNDVLLQKYNAFMGTEVLRELQQKQVVNAIYMAVNALSNPEILPFRVDELRRFYRPVHY